MTENDCTQYVVTWRKDGEERVYTSRCETWAGYSTTSDFPRMLSIRHMPNGVLDAERVIVESVTKVGE